jgi:hypothetical protein
MGCKDTCDPALGPVDKIGPRTFNILAVPYKNNGIFNATAIANDSCSPIQRSEYFLGHTSVGSCGTPGTGTPMDATDGSFDELLEDVKKDDVQYFRDGVNWICVKSQDTANNWGNCNCTYFETDAVPPDCATNITMDTVMYPYEYLICGNTSWLNASVCDSQSRMQGGEYFFDLPPQYVPEPWSGVWMSVLSNYTDSRGYRCSMIGALVDPANLADGTHYIKLRAKDNVENWGKMSECASVSFIKDTTPPVTSKVLVPYGDMQHECTSDEIAAAALPGGIALTNGCQFVKAGTKVQLHAQDPDPQGTNEFAGNERIHWKIWYKADGSSSWVIDQEGVSNADQDVEITLSNDSYHLVEYWSEDLCGWQETHHFELDIVDTKPPVTTKTVGEPKLSGSGFDYWITQQTPITLSCADQNPHPSDHVTLYARYKVDDGSWVDLTTSNGYVQFTFPEDSIHTLEWHCVDQLGNTEVTRTEVDRVDTVPPTTVKTYGLPLVEAVTGGYPKWINSSTPVTLTPTDGGEICHVGVNKTYWRNTLLTSNEPCMYTENCQEQTGVGPWNVYTGQFYKPEDSCHLIEYYSVDLLGNTEIIKKQCVYVDNKSPVSSKAVGDPKKQVDCSTTGEGSFTDGCYYINQSTSITLSCNDQEPHPVDNVKIFYKSDWKNQSGDSWQLGSWTQDSSQVTFYYGSDSYHRLTWYCVDALGNKEADHTELDIVDTQKPVSYKTLGDPKHVCTLDEQNANYDPLHNPAQTDGCYYINQSTPVTINCADGQPHPVDNVKIWYRTYLSGDTNPPAFIQDSNSVTFNYDVDSAHVLEWYCLDELGNTETTHVEYDIVETVPPSLEKSIVGPWYGACLPKTENDVCFIDGVTKIHVVSVDPTPHPVDHVTCDWDYEVLDGVKQGTGQTGVTPPFDINFPEESTHRLTITCRDALGNRVTDVEKFVVDKTPPVTRKSFSGLLQYPKDGDLLTEGLGTAGNFVILSKSGITNVPTSAITGNIGTSPITGASIAGLGCPEVNGTIYTVDAAGPSCRVVDPVLLTAAVSDMEAAYTDLAGRAPANYIDLYGGNIGGQILTPGIYKWNTGVIIPTDVTLSGGANDVWIFQIAQNLDISSAMHVMLSGGAQAKNIFWVVAGTTTLEPTSVFNGNILGATTIALQNGATLNGRALSQTDVTLIADTVSLPNVTTTSNETSHWITSGTNVTLSVYDAGIHKSGIKETKYRITQVGDEYCASQTACQGAAGSGDFLNYVTPFAVPEQSCHLIEYYSVDNVNKTETVKKQCVFVDNTPPVTTKTVGEPKHACEGSEECDWYITKNTEINLSCTDQLPHPVDNVKIYYKIDWKNQSGDAWQEGQWVEDGSFVTIKYPEDSYHKLSWYCVDALGNAENTNSEIDAVDTLPPVSQKRFIGTAIQCSSLPCANQSSCDYYITQSTKINLTCNDLQPHPVDHQKIYYRYNVDDGIWTQWIEYTAPFNYTEDSKHTLEWYCVDALGNTETTHIQVERVDTKPPVTNKTIGDPKWQDGYWVTSQTPITLTAVDQAAPCASDSGKLNYKVSWDKNCDGDFNDHDEQGTWQHVHVNTTTCKLEKTLYLQGECLHEIRWYAEDALGNVEAEHVQQHKVDNTPPHILILKPVDGWYSSGEDLPIVAETKDLNNANGPCESHGYDCNELTTSCAVGIADGAQCYAYLANVNFLNTNPQDTFNLGNWAVYDLNTQGTLLYNATAKECQGYATIPDIQGMGDGIYILVVGAKDSLNNSANSFDEIKLAIHETCDGCGGDPYDLCEESCVRDVVQDIITSWNLPKIGIDNHAPVVTITDPEENTLFGGETLDFSADVSDSQGGQVTSTITSGTPCYVTLGGVSLGAVPYDNSAGKCMGTIMIPQDTDFPQGTQPLKVEITDNAGNLGSDSIDVNVDTVKPAVAFVSPAANSFVKGIVNVQFTISDVNIDPATARLSFDNGDSWVTPICAAGTCSYAWDTTTATDGMAYEMDAKVSDMAGNVGKAERIVIVDNGPPESVVITYPYNSQYLTGTTTTEAAVSDSVTGVSSVEFQYYDTSWHTISTDTSAPWTASFAACSYTAATKLRAIATDGLGNQLTSTEVPITVDCTPPTVTINAPAGPVSGYQPISATVDADVVSVQFDIASVMPYTICYDSVSPFAACMLDTRMVSDGTHTIYAYAKDRAGLSGSSSKTINIDNTPPVVAITSPSVNSFVKGTVNVQFTISDVNIDPATARLSLDNGKSWVTPTCISGACSYAWDTTTATDGMAHGLIAKASDTAGNTGKSEMVIVIVDNGAPDTLYVVNPIKDEITDGTITLKVLAGDQVTNISRVTIYVNSPVGWSCDANYASGVWQCDFNTNTKPDGAHEVYATAWDYLNNAQYSTHVPFIIDNNAPSAPVLSIYPASNGYDTDGVVTWQWGESSDSGSGVDYYIVEYGSPVVSDTKVLGTTFTISDLTDGTHSAKVKAVDKAGHESAWSNDASVIVDTVAPTVNIVTPADNQFVKGTQTIIADIYDADLVPSSVMISTDNGQTWNSAYACDPSEYCYDWDTTAATDGMAYGLIAKATDQAGNVGYSAPVVAIVDNGAPEGVYMVDPVKDGIVQGTITLKALATDYVSGVESVKIYVNSVPSFNCDATLVGGTWQCSFDSTTLLDGQHSAYAVATDKLGQITTSASVPFVIDNNAPTTPEFIYFEDSNSDGYDNDGVLTLRWGASSDTGSGMDYYEVIISSPGYMHFTVDAQHEDYTPFITVSDLYDGVWHGKVRAWDKAGHASEWTDPTQIIVDTIKPADIDVEATETEKGSKPLYYDTNGAYNIVWTGGSDANFDNYKLYENGANIYTGSDTSKAFSDVEDGTYEYYMISADEAGWSTTSGKITVTVDTVAPTIEVSGPTGFMGMWTFTYSVNDASPSSGIDRVEVSDADTNFVTCFPQGWCMVIGGTYVELTAYDKAGNHASDDTNGAPADTTPPMITRTDPSGVIDYNKVLLEVNTSEPSTCYYGKEDDLVYMLPMTAGLDQMNHEAFLGGALADGLYVYHVQCEDEAGNWMEHSKTIVFYVNTAGEYCYTADLGLGDSSTGWKTFFLPQLILDDINFNCGVKPYATADVLSSIAGKYDIVYYYDDVKGWLFYSPQYPEFSTLKEFNDDASSPYYIKMNGADRLELTCNQGCQTCTAERTYTVNADFDEGTLIGLEHTTVADQLQLEEGQASTYPVMWIANAGEDTLSKWDTSTNKELARYATWFGAPNSHGAWSGAAPSRTAVDIEGNCYVANRHFDDYPADVIKILSDGYIDRNSNGVMDTSTDTNSNGVIEPSEMLPLVDLNQNGKIDDNEIQDERIAWVASVGSNGALGRSLAIDLNGDIWLGLYNTAQYYKLSGVDGSVLAGPINVAPNTPYGALVDKNGILWGASLGCYLLKLDTNTGTVLNNYYQCNIGSNYGITLSYDAQGNTHAYLGGTSYTYIEFNSATEQFSTPAQEQFYTLGLATDKDGNIVAGKVYGGGAAKFAKDGSVIWSVPGQYEEGSARGTVVDSNNDVWVIDVDSSKMYKYSGIDGAPLGIFDTGLYPYTYSDASGLGLRASIRAGTWDVIFDSQQANTVFQKISWDENKPEGTEVTVKVRSSTDQVSWSQWETVTNGGDLSSTPSGQYLEIQTSMKVVSGEISPILYDLTVNGACGEQNLII